MPKEAFELSDLWRERIGEHLGWYTDAVSEDPTWPLAPAQPIMERPIDFDLGDSWEDLPEAWRFPDSEPATGQYRITFGRPSTAPPMFPLLSGPKRRSGARPAREAGRPPRPVHPEGVVGGSAPGQGRWKHQPGIDGSAAGIDPALWALGRMGSSRCEQRRSSSRSV